MARGTSHSLDENETIEFSGFVDALTAVEQTHDFIVVDTAGSDTHLTRIAHSMADTLITPLNDSFVDFAVLGKVDPATYNVTGESHYARWCARPRRSDGSPTACRWTSGGAQSAVDAGFTQQAARDQGPKRAFVAARFRSTDALASRVIYHEFFPRGLTAPRQSRRGKPSARARACPT